MTTPSPRFSLETLTRSHYKSMTRVDIHPLTPWAKWEDLPPAAKAEKMFNMQVALEEAGLGCLFGTLT